MYVHQLQTITVFFTFNMRIVIQQVLLQTFQTIIIILA